jgi:hypothetical protein
LAHFCGADLRVDIHPSSSRAQAKDFTYGDCGTEVN